MVIKLRDMNNITLIKVKVIIFQFSASADINNDTTHQTKSSQIESYERLVSHEKGKQYCLNKALSQRNNKEGGKGGFMIPFHTQILTKFTCHVQF